MQSHSLQLSEESLIGGMQTPPPGKAPRLLCILSNALLGPRLQPAKGGTPGIRWTSMQIRDSGLHGPHMQQQLVVVPGFPSWPSSWPHSARALLQPLLLGTVDAHFVTVQAQHEIRCTARP